MTDREFQTIIDKLDNLEQDTKFLAEKLELYQKVSDEKIELYQEKLELYQKVSDEKLEAYQKASDEQVKAIREEIKAYQEANKQQLNVSLGVLVTAAVAIIVSAVVNMAN